MFYSIRILLLTCMVAVPGMHGQDKKPDHVISSLKGIRAAAIGMGLGFLIGKQMNNEIAATVLGAVGAMALDHYLFGGKEEDKHHHTRKCAAVCTAILGLQIVPAYFKT